MSCFQTGGPGKDHRTNKPPPTGRVQERSKCDTTYPTTSQNPHWHPSWLNKACTTRKYSESEWLAKDNPETNPITVKPKQFSWVPLPYCSLPGCPFPIKSRALPAHVSPQTVHFQGLDKSPFWGPGRIPPFLNRTWVSCIAGRLNHLIYQGSPRKTNLSWMHAKLLQSCLTFCNPVNCSPSGSSVLYSRVSPGKNIRVGCHFLLQQIFPTQALSCKSPALSSRFFTTVAIWEAQVTCWNDGNSHLKYCLQLKVKEDVVEGSSGLGLQREKNNLHGDGKAKYW